MFAAVNAWTFDVASPISQQLKQAADAGFEGFEPVIAPDAAITSDTNLSDCEAISRQAADLGLKLTSLASAEFWQFNYASPSENDRQKAVDLTLQMLDRAAAMQAKAILVVSALVGKASDTAPAVSYAEALSVTFDTLSRLKPEAESRGVTIAIENVWNRFLLSPVEAADLIDRVNSPNVGVYLDTGNVLAFGYPEDWVDTLGHRVTRVHIKDYDLRKPGGAGFCELGAGSVNWPAVVEALAEAGYDGPLVYEGEGDPAVMCGRVRKIIAREEISAG